MALSLRNLGKKLWDQVNPLDNGRTWKNPQGRAPAQQRAGQAPPSAWQQATHNGATNFVGDAVVKPFVVNPLQIASEAGRNVGAIATHNEFARQASDERMRRNVAASLPVAMYNEGKNVVKGTVISPAEQILATIEGNAEKERQASVRGTQALNQTFLGQFLSPVQDVMTGDEQGRKLAAEAGYDKDRTWAAKYVGDPAMGGVDVIGGALTLKVAKTGKDGVKPVHAHEAGAATMPGTKPTVRQKGSEPTPAAEPTANEITNKAVEAEKSKYGQSLGEKLMGGIQKFVDPGYKLTELDKAYEKQLGRPLTAEESMSAAYDKSLYSARQANAMLHDKYDLDTGTVNSDQKAAGTSIADLTQKYKGDEGKAFINYLNYRFAEEVQAKRRVNLTPELTPEQRSAGIKQFEATHPEALRDAAVVKAHGDRILDHAVEKGLIDKAEAAEVKATYQNFVPLSRTMADDIVRPKIDGQNLGSVSQQRVLRSIEQAPSRTSPLDNTFDAMIERTHTALKQGNQADLARLYLERNQQGFAPGELKVAAGNLQARRNARDNMKVIKRSNKHLTRTLSTRKRHVKVLEKELNNLNKEGTKASIKEAGRSQVKGKVKTKTVTVRQGLKRTTVKEGTVGRATTAKQIIDKMVDAATPVAEVRRIQKKIATREPKLAELLEQVIERKEALKSNEHLKNEQKNIVRMSQDESTAGVQTISGMLNGQPFKLEVHPEVANAMQGLDVEKLGPLARALQAPTRIFQTLWTGFANPVFSGISFALYDLPMSVINSKHGIKVLAPRAVGEMFKSFDSNTEFQRQLQRAGAQTVGGSQLATDAKLTADSLASESDFLSRMKFNTTHFSEGLNRLDILGGKLANATRTRVAKAHYDEAVKSGMEHEAALAEAVRAFNNVMPNYGRASTVAKQLNAVLPYFTASIAGTRSMFQAARANPGQFTLKATAIGVAPVVGASAYNLSTEEGQEYYKDLIESERAYDLDNNIVIVLPGAKRDEETGKWSGIVKIPVAPEMRPVTSAAWRGTYDFTNGKAGDQASATRMATALFDFGTGGVRTITNPVIESGAAIAGVDMGRSNITRGANVSDGMITNPNMQYLTPEEQAKSSKVSPTAKRIGEALGLPPNNVEKVLGKLGFAGTLLKNKEGNYAKTAGAAVGNRFYGSTGQSEGARYFDSLKDAAKQSGIAGKDYEALEYLMASEIDPDGNKQPLDDKDALAKNELLASSPAVAKVISDAAKARAKRAGKDLDPLYNLTPKQQEVYYRQQATPYKSDDYEKLDRDNPWMEKFRDDRRAYFDKNPIDGKGESGKVKFPEFGAETQGKIDEYFAMGEDTEVTGQQRAEYLANNPDVSKALDAMGQYTNDKRVAQGFAPFDKYPKADEATQAILNEYNAIPKGGGKRGGNKHRSDWIKANPDKYAKMSDYFAAAAAYKVATEAGKAKYADEELNQDALAGISSLARNITSTTDESGKKVYAIGSGESMGSSFSGGNGGGGGGSRFATDDDPTTYAGAAGLRNPYALQVKAPKSKFKGKTKVKVSGKKPTVRKAGSGRAGKGRVAKNMPKRKSKVALKKATI